MNLQDQGHRYVERNGDFRWRHPYDTQPGDVDCTDMTDHEFSAFVRSFPPQNPEGNLIDCGDFLSDAQGSALDLRQRAIDDGLRDAYADHFNECVMGERPEV